jgi:hypothetical protein
MPGQLGPAGRAVSAGRRPVILLRRIGSKARSGVGGRIHAFLLSDVEPRLDCGMRGR